jgi:elongation of very long chain fatty acids protein 4
MCQTTTFTDVNTVKLGNALPQPSRFARYACAGLMLAIFQVWGNFVFVDESTAPGLGSPLHSFHVPLFLTSAYLVSLPLLRSFTKRNLSSSVDVKALLKETMIVYNGGQVLLNGWMVWKIIDAVMYRSHPFFGDVHTISGASFACWVHYMDKYLEFFDTFFMVLRGRMDQVRNKTLKF